MGEIAIDWGSADVIDGRLTVAFSEKPPKEWVRRLEWILERLERGRSGWGAIAIARKMLHVEDVEPGAEADLHHFLDSALLQANADEATGDEAAGAPRSERDQALTDAFRGFAGRTR